MKNRKHTLSTNQTIPGTQVKGITASGGNQPPRKSIVPRAHMRRIETYSPRKKRRKGVEEYSTWKPATSSDSASTRSKGGRLVSASAETKKTTNIGRSGSQCQSSRLLGKPKWLPMPRACDITMSLKLSEPTSRRTVTRTKPMETS